LQEYLPAFFNTDSVLQADRNFSRPGRSAGFYEKYGVIITTANFIYNICPVFLQQYNRLRIQRLSKARQALMR
jgi:hypothetical protein